MPKLLHNALNAKAVAVITEPGFYADGAGLALLVKKEGTKSWIWRGKLDGKMTKRGLGGLATVSLANARSKAKELAGEARTQAKEVREAKPKPAPRFGALALEYINAKQSDWTNQKHRQQWVSTLWTHALPLIERRVDEISSADVLECLEKDGFWVTKRETASRVRQRMEAIFDRAIVLGHRADNPAGKFLLKVLPKSNRSKHYRALPYADVPRTLKRVRRCTAYPATKMAFEFLVLTAVRSGEVREARWSEIDWETATWSISAERMKARRPHRVPLAAQSVAILREAWELSGPEGLIFPAKRSGKALTDMALNAILRRLKVDAVPHGFRSSFRDWAAEQSGAGWAVCESALAHNVGNSTEAAYMRSDLFEQRRGLMQDWADFCTG